VRDSLISSSVYDSTEQTDAIDQNRTLYPNSIFGHRSRKVQSHCCIKAIVHRLDDCGMGFNCVCHSFDFIVFLVKFVWFRIQLSCLYVMLTETA